MSNKSQSSKSGGFFAKFLELIENVGNKLPHPVTIFIILSCVIAIISHLAAMSGISVTYYDAKAGEEASVSAVSLLDKSGIFYMITSAVSNFTGFAPLGTVLVVMLGIGVAEGTGMIGTALKKVVLNTPKNLVTAVVIFAGIMSNVASDVGYVVLVPLGAIVFASFGRHPFAGIAAAFAGVSGGFSANLLVGTIDPLLSGITNSALEAAGSVHPITQEAYIVSPAGNYYFLFVSTFLLTILGSWVVEKIVEPRLGVYDGPGVTDSVDITKEEENALNKALLVGGLFVVIMLVLTVPENGLLRQDGEITPLVSNGLVPIITTGFFIPGLVYGIAMGNIQNDKQTIKLLNSAMSNMGGYLVLAFFASQFVAYFGYTKLGLILAVGGAEFLQSINFTGLPLVIAFIVVSAFINLFIGSASAKWAIMAPVFVPMLLNVGITPEFTQLAYRIGDSTTNIISPLMSYFAVIITFAEKYQKGGSVGIGSIISMMLPFSLVFLAGWTVLLIVWYLLGLPIGPGAPMTLPI